MDENLQQRVYRLEAVMNRLIAHLAEDGALSHGAYDLVCDLWDDLRPDLQTPPQ